jgi:hypothetical protein
MAQGDLVVFDDAMEYMLDGGWATDDAIWLAITSDTPGVTDAVPGMEAGATTTYTPVATAGTYAQYGQLLCTWADYITEISAGIIAGDDTGATATWAQDGANPVNGKYGVVYNHTNANGLAICFIDLNATAVVDMTAGALTVTWNASGMFRVTRAA